MSFGLLNLAMLAGLLGVSLPVLAHLLSKRKFDVVNWGAMQFLDLGHRTRRRIRLEEMLLMLLRMGVIAIVVLGLARPWVSGAWFSRYISTETRDVVIVLDSSYSMGYEGGEITPHAAAKKAIRELLDHLLPGDTVSLIDARERPHVVFDQPTRDLDLVRKTVDELAEPAGGGDLAEATQTAIRLLARTTNLRRDVIVLTDGQARPWSADDTARWEIIDDLAQQPAVTPHLWVLDVSQGSAKGDRTNFSLERLKLSRDFTAVNLPVRIETKIRYTGGQTPIQRRVYLEVDGQRLADATIQTPVLQPDSEYSLHFEHRFAAVGSHLVSVVLDPDNLPGDNRAEAAVLVTDALPALLVDGDPHRDPIRSETFFARAALSASENDTPLVRATVVPIRDLTVDRIDLVSTKVIVLANVPTLTDEQVDALEKFVTEGGGLFVALGDKVNADEYNRRLFASGDGLLPAVLKEIKSDEGPNALGTHVTDGSLVLPFVAPFRTDRDGTLTQVRFSKWWRVEEVVAKQADPVVARSPDRATEADRRSPRDSGDLRSAGRRGQETRAEQLAPRRSPTVSVARLDTNDPFLLGRDFGRGRVLLMTAPLDSDWSTLPAKPDFVPLLHELLFHLAGSAAASRNVETGEPLIFAVSPEIAEQAAAFRFVGPGQKEFSPQRGGDDTKPVLRLDDTHVPGVYVLRPKPDVAPPAAVAAIRNEHFVVNFDRGESDLKPLDDTQQAKLSANDRLKFLENVDDLQTRLAGDAPQSEIWQFMMLVILALLAGELFLTRRLVSQGYTPSEEAVT
jgi:hypothetical protein